MSELPKNPIKAPDYERIAAEYDRRYEDGVFSGIRNLVQECMEQSAPGRWLEVGCGTGQWLAQTTSGLRRFGLDQSRSMLLRASAKTHGVPLVQASA
ncbi:MAG: class I SAM-dependent methyltransferase, partial [Anaerolineales bacterium]